ncbi:hypothetical protein ACHAXS_008681 [Conticribra weissflogii]
MALRSGMKVLSPSIATGFLKSSSLASFAVPPSSCQRCGFRRSHRLRRAFSSSSSSSSSFRKKKKNESVRIPIRDTVHHPHLHHPRHRSLSSSSNNHLHRTPPEPPSSFVRHLIDEVTCFVQDLRLFLPRILACASTLYLCSEYGFKTIPCEGPSMEPTIMDGRNTVVLLERWSHRLFGLEESGQSKGTNARKQSRHADDAPNSTRGWTDLLRGIWEQHFRSGLQRGDVVILRHPEREGTICKRIVGMPGDALARSHGSEVEEVPRGHIWVEGDNAPQSHDSRYYGPVPASLVIGKVICRLWPLRDYEWMDRDADGRDGFRRIDGRIGRRYRTT